jgi:hypothetical protein
MVDYHLDCRVRVDPNPGFYSHKWSIIEVSNDGARRSNDYIPFRWSLFFDIKHLRYVASVKGEMALRDKAEMQQSDIMHVSEHLTGTMVPANNNYPRRKAPYYSIFGTARIVKEFSFHIEVIPEDQTEECRMWGSAAFTDKVLPHIEELVPDVVGVTIYLKQSTFADFIGCVKSAGKKRATLVVSDVSGFYVEPDPVLDRGDVVKILIDAEKQKLEIPEGFDISPPVLHNVGSFSLYFFEDMIGEEAVTEAS